MRARERELRRRLGEQPLPGEVAAGARAWPLIAAALAEREPAARRPRLARSLAPALALAAAIAALVLVLTPAGPALGDWIESRFAAEPVPATPAFAALPEGGRALALSSTGAFVVRPDGSLRQVGAFSEAGWSPRGLHVVGVSGRRVVAVDPLGTQKWTVARPGRVSHPAWSAGDGFFVAYLEGAALRVVGGNGAGDRLLRRGAAAVTPAWRPGAGYALAYARPGGIESVDAVSGARLWSRPARGVLELAWSRNGARLAVLEPGRLRVLDRRGRLLQRVPLAPGARALALHPSGRRAAVLLQQRRGARVVEVAPALAGAPAGATRSLFEGPGTVEGLEWSPDGSRLLVAWRDADQWLLIGPGRRVRTLSNVSRELGAGSGFPRLVGWCCRP